MKAMVVQYADVVTYVVVSGPGDEAVAALAQFVSAEATSSRTGVPHAGGRGDRPRPRGDCAR